MIRRTARCAHLHTVADALLPPSPQVLTPDEFVAAGDYLIRTCPTWSWCVAVRGAGRVGAGSALGGTRQSTCLVTGHPLNSKVPPGPVQGGRG